MKKPPTVCLTVDVEPDCPPFLWTWRGIEEGMPKLLDLFANQGVTGTFFVTGKTAEKFPDCVRAIVEAGHEIGNHGLTHNSFAKMTCEEAEEEIGTTSKILAGFADVVSFRAPYLTFPPAFETILPNHGIRIDSSRARYKFWRSPAKKNQKLFRIEASISSSWLRLPSVLRTPMLQSLNDPVTLFVHPWEFVDLTKESIRWDCRVGTGEPALNDLRDTIHFFKDRGADFVHVQDVFDLKFSAA